LSRREKRNSQHEEIKEIKMRSSKQKSSLLPLIGPPFSQLLVLMADDEISNHLLRKPLELLPELLHGGLVVLLDARSQLTWGLLAVAATGGAAEPVLFLDF